MGDSEVPAVTSRKKFFSKSLDDYSPKGFLQRDSRLADPQSRGRRGIGKAGDLAVFILKVAALETVRRLSRSRCPFLWHGIQGLQVLCYPPFKWIQGWAPFKGLVGKMQILSRPLLVISIATAFSDQSLSTETSEDSNNSAEHTEEASELSPVLSIEDTRISDGAAPSTTSESWMLQLYKDLRNHGISLPERIDEDELFQFHKAANGDYSVLLSSIKKTIRWRENYRILSEQELEAWSNMVFWHGLDVMQRPCLIVRLGLACSILPSHERPIFAQAVISQVEHGVVYLLNADSPYITVVVDCEGLSPLKIPMQMLRSCSSLLQHHFPNRLGYLFVVRLPPIVRVIAQTFFQILKPATRKKLKLEGDMYRSVLSEFLLTPPACLGGSCICSRCSDMISLPNREQPQTNEMETGAYLSDCDDLLHSSNFHSSTSNCDVLLRTCVIGILMVWVFIALMAGLSDPQSRPF